VTIEMLRTVRYAARSLVAAPGFTTLAVLTLALGIGANSAIFSVVYGVLQRPLPYHDAERLVVVQREQQLIGARAPMPVFFFAPADIAAWQQAVPSFESTALYAPENAALATPDGAEVIDSAVVSGSFFATMAGPMAAGRPLGPSDDLGNSVVISERLSRRLFGGGASAIGQPLTLSSRPYVVAGVAGSAFHIPLAQTDVWIPYGYARSLSTRCCAMRLIGRLKPDQTVERAGEHAVAFAKTTAPAGAVPSTNVRVRVTGLRDQIVGAVRPGLLILFAAAGLVLFTACVNVTNLVLTRQAAGTREAAIRRALGASRGRLIVERLTEHVLLAASGAGLGIVLAVAVVSGLVSVGTSGLPRLDAIRVDAPVLMFSIVLAGAAVLLTGLLPALRSTNPADTLRSAASCNVTPTRRGRRVRGALCVAELAISLVLLVGVGLLGRSLMRLLQTDLGVTTERVATASLNLAFASRPPDAQVLERIDRVIERIGALPGVQAAGVGTSLPPNASRIRLTLRRAGDSVDYQASGVAVTPGYFDALGFRLVKGRLFTAADDLNRPHVMIMSLDTARRFFGEGDPIGRTMSLPTLRNGVTKSEEMTLVGVVANVRYSGLAAEPDDAVYRPFAQQPWMAPFLVARTAQEPDALLPILRREIAAVDRAIVVSDVKTLDAVVSESTTQPRFRTVLLAGMASLAILVAAVGLFGVVGQSVSQRSREIGIRIALGARPDEIRWMVLREGACLGLAGIALGVPAAFIAARALTGILYGVASTDAWSFAFAAGGLLMITLAATYVPAARAARVDPLIALRTE
jgi:putative ABC transport system permease protein